MRPALVVGFAAETENLVDNAREKLKKKGCDLIVANDVSKERGVFGGDKNTVQLVSASGVESWGLMSKQDVAQRLMQQLAAQLPTGKA
jgi:phosphopantothenoylcysteine decarboxylase/phosphopantothenate--cysteine ligase